MQTLEDYTKQIKSLPPGPRILSRLIVLLRKPDLDCEEVINLISFDAGLTTRVLGRCNSARYGLSQPVYDLPEAVIRLGYNEVYKLVAHVVGEAALKGPQEGYGFAPGELWEHSATTAVAAKIIAGATLGDENLLFTAALLHDIGKLVLNSSLEGKYDLVLTETEECGCSLLETEKLILGVEHAELGGRILQEWNFPESLVQSVRHHHDPMQAAPYESLAACVCVADLIAHLAGHGSGYQSFAVHAESAPAQLLGIGPKDVEALVLETETIIKQNKLFHAEA